MSIAASTEQICFLILASIIISGSLGVVLINNIVYSAFLLGGVFLSVAGLYLLLNASFVAAAQVLVYVGAVNVLILFAIMLVNKREDLKPIKGLRIRKFFSGIVCAGLLALLLRVDLTTDWSTPGPPAIGEQATERIGEHLFTDYLLPFELASVLLLMAMIGAIVLASREVILSEADKTSSVNKQIVSNTNEAILIDQSNE